jgi:hypothetical protein
MAKNYSAKIWKGKWREMWFEKWREIWYHKNGGKYGTKEWRENVLARCGGCSCLSLLLALEVRPREGLHSGKEADLTHPPGQGHGPALLHSLHGIEVGGWPFKALASFWSQHFNMQPDLAFMSNASNLCYSKRTYQSCSPVFF